MTQEERKLTLKDLCARSPHGVKIHLYTIEYGELIGTLDAVYPTDERVIVDNLDKAIAPINVRCGGFKIEEDKVKPYLRPMSSMTEEEKKEFCKIEGRIIQYFPCKHIKLIFSADEFDWLNAHHFDYRGLIEKGLALEAPEGMYIDDKFVPITKEELEKTRISSKDYLI